MATHPVPATIDEVTVERLWSGHRLGAAAGSGAYDLADFLTQSIESDLADQQYELVDCMKSRLPERSKIPIWPN